MAKDRILLYSKKCLSCTHLVDGARKTYDSCHYHKGNERCPAQYLKMVINVDIDAQANELASAIRSNDQTQYDRAQKRLGKLDSVVGSAVRDAADRLIATDGARDGKD